MATACGERAGEGAHAKPNKVRRRRFSTARDVCCRPEGPLWEKTSKRQRHKRWIQPRARGSARAEQEGGRSAREGPRKATRRKTQPASTRRSEPGGASLEPGSRFAPFSNSISGLGGSRARVGARRSQAGARLKSANLPYEEPFSPDPPHLLNIILFKKWGDQRKGACRPAEVSPSRILKGGLSRPRAEAVLYKRAGFFVKEAHSAPGRSESVQSVLQWPALME